MSNLDESERLNLQEMIKSYGADDNTEKIRSLKHSKLIKENVDILMNLKRRYSRMVKTDKKGFERLAIKHCNFLWENYTNIFNKLMKDEIDVKILFRFINKLHEIEEGIVDQHEASVGVGKILKEMYIDSALRHEKKFEEEELKRTGGKKKKERKPHKNISWAKFKASGLNAS